MTRLYLIVLLLLVGATAIADESDAERNKALALEFYENLWFSNRTDRYVDFVADEYVIHDIGPNKGVVEAGITQKQIADRFHSFGELTGEIDYQIAEGDKVATRWFIYLNPNQAAIEMGMTPVDGVAIINVFRFDDAGKSSKHGITDMMWSCRALRKASEG